jgi:glycosyltransferase involved in cell wall biosynthesis
MTPGAPAGSSRWAVLTQVQSPTFQRLWENLACRFGPCLLVTGMPFDVAPDAPLAVRKAAAYDRRGLGRRALSWGRYLLGAAGALAARGGPARVLAVGNPPLLPHLAWVMGRLRRVRYALIIWDIFPDHLVEMGWLGGSNPVVKAWAGLNRRALLGAEVVITLSEGMAETIRRGLGEGAAACRIDVIPSWADTDLVRPLEKSSNAFAISQDQTDKTTVMYAGNMGASHDLATIVAAAADLRDDERLRFMFVGGGFGREKLEKSAAAIGLGNVTFSDWVPWADVPVMLAAADIAVVAQTSRNADLSLPSKTYNAMAAGSAILAITPAGSDLARLVRDHGAGEVCDPGDVAGAVRAIRRLADDPARLRGARESARASAEAHFSAPVIHARYADVLGETLFA